jgi:hypothetical protein
MLRSLRGHRFIIRHDFQAPNLIGYLTARADIFRYVSTHIVQRSFHTSLFTAVYRGAFFELRRLMTQTSGQDPDSTSRSLLFKLLIKYVSRLLHDVHDSISGSLLAPYLMQTY